MRVTLLTPTLNAERFFPEALASIAAQTYPRERIEHLVIDGASSDATAALAREAGAEVHVAKDRSLYEAMNRGLALASGEIVGWLNADDAAAPGAVQAVVDAFERSPEAEIVVGDHRMLFPDGRVLTVRGRQDALVRLRNGERRGAWVAPLAVFFRTPTLRALGGYDARYRVAADLDLWLRAASRASLPILVHAGATLGTFRFHEGSLSSGRGLDQSLAETMEIGRRWADDTRAPPGVRRFGLFVYRRHLYLGRSRAVAGQGLAARVRVAATAWAELRRLGPGALRDMTTGLADW